MNELREVEIRRETRRTARRLTVLLTAVLALGIAVAIRFPNRDLGPVQPIPFSHLVHAGQKEIGCLVCHPEAAITSTAGIPPLERCMHCHTRIIPAFPWIRELRSYFVEGRPVKWVKITKLPDFVYFPHSVHLARSVDCGYCHGDVKSMDRIVPVREINMGFCMDCHREYGASIDCFTCHR